MAENIQCPELFRHSALILAAYSLFGFQFDDQSFAFKICYFDFNEDNRVRSAAEFMPIFDMLKNSGANTLTFEVVSETLCVLKIAWHQYEYIPKIIASLLANTMITFTLMTNANIVLKHSNFDLSVQFIPVIFSHDFFEWEFIKQQKEKLLASIETISPLYLSIWNYATDMGKNFCNQLWCRKRGYGLQPEIDWMAPDNYYSWIDFMPLETMLEEILEGFGPEPYHHTRQALWNNPNCMTFSIFFPICMCCQVKQPDARAFPCGHCVSCAVCAPKLLTGDDNGKCPICGHMIVKYIPINLQRKPNQHVI